MFWNDLARATGRALGQWSGIYVNRNLLGLVLSYGLLATLFWLSDAPNPRPAAGLVVVFGALLFKTGSRTGPVAFAGALAVASAVWLFRRQGSSRMSAASGAYVSFATLGTLGLFVHYYWAEEPRVVGPRPTLTSRTFIWEVDRYFADQRPWTGQGFEALWTNPKAIEQAYGATGRYPYSAHNGYFEVS